MLAGAQSRTIFAGLGVTGCLIAAVGVVFVITGGVLAFQGWPDAPAVRSKPALSVAAAARATAPQNARALQLPAASAPAFAGRRAALTGAGTRKPVGQGRQSNTGRGPAGAPSLTGPPPLPVTPATPPASPTPAAAPTTLSALVRSTTGAVANTVRGVGSAVPAARPVTNTLADTIDRAGHLLGPLTP